MVILKSMLSKIKSIPLLVSATSVLFWQILTLLLSFITSVISTRILGPSNLGLVGIIISFTQQIILLISVTPNNYLVRELNKFTELEKSNFISSVIMLRFICALIFVMIIFFVDIYFFNGTIWFLPILIGIPIILVSSVNSTWVLQSQEKQSSQYKVNFFIVLSNLVLVLFLSHIIGLTPLLYLLILLISTVIGSYLSIKYSNVKFEYYLFRLKSFMGLKNHVNKSIYIYITDLLIYIYASSQLSIIGFMLTTHEAGLYRAANSLVGSFHSVFLIIPILLYPRFIQWRKNGIEYLWSMQIKLLIYLSIFCIIIFALAFVFSPIIFPIIFGDEFSNASFIFVILLSSKLLVILNGLFAYGLLTHDEDKFMLIYFLLTSVISLGLTLFFLPKFGAIAAAYVCLFSEFLIFAFTFFASYKIVNNNRKNKWKNMTI
jgi:O-antigen/teichoic acid export membrane protein